MAVVVLVAASLMTRSGSEVRSFVFFFFSHQLCSDTGISYMIHDFFSFSVGEQIGAVFLAVCR